MLNLFFTFCVFSIAGWLLEVIYRSYTNRKFVNPGLLKGPYLILYGVGGVVLFYLTAACHSLSIIWKIIIYGGTTTLLELISALMAEYFFQKKLWDYSDNRFNYKGYICLKFSFYWIILAFVFEYIIAPFYSTYILSLPQGVKVFLTASVLVLMTIDFKNIFIEHFFNYSPEEEKILFQRFIDLATPILSHPQVRKLKEYPHHRDKNRLEHVIEVAYWSYLLGHKLSLDTHAIVRAALLHDLFFYDWLREGPRLHGLRHPKISLANAKKHFDLSPREEDIIKKHMWPLTPIPPRYMESLVVAVVDSVCSLKDYLCFFRKKSHLPLEVLRESEMRRRI